MDVEDSLSLRITKFGILALATVIFTYSIVVYYLSTSQYTFSSYALPADSIPCYSNFTNAMKETTAKFSFDFWIITSQPIVIATLALNLSCCASNINQVISLLVSAINFIAIAFYFTLRIIYYTISKGNCSSYWFCITPCDSWLSGAIGTDTSVEFYISWFSDAMLLVLSVASVVGIPIIRRIRDAIKNRALNGENIGGKYTEVDQMVLPVQDNIDDEFEEDL